MNKPSFDFLKKNAGTLAEVFPQERFNPKILALIEQANAIAVACSGGADSLMALLWTWSKFPKLRSAIFALHYNHGLRGKDAADDALFVKNLCSDLGIQFVEETLSAEQMAHSEANLREHRLAFFARAMREHKINILVQGHQSDDIAETLVMRIVRGTGTAGLAAPRPISKQHDGRIFIRPLLGISKIEIINCLKKLNIPWREDATNAENDYFRNRIRNKILPLLREHAPVLNFSRTRELAEEDDAALWELANSKKLGELPLAGIVRRQVWAILNQKNISLKRKHIDKLVSAIVNQEKIEFVENKNKVKWTGTELLLSPVEEKNPKTQIDAPAELAKTISAEPILITEEILENLRQGKFSEKESSFLAGTPEIFVRSRKHGDRYRPLGSPGEKLLSDALIDKKIPKKIRDLLPVVCDGMGIAWIPGLPPAERFRILRPGVMALRLTYHGASLTL